MSDLYSNYVFCRVASTVSSGATSISVDNVTNLPSNAQVTAQDFYMAFDSGLSYPYTQEIVKVTAISGTTLTVTRAQEGTTARSWAVGTLIRGSLTAGMLNRLSARTRQIVHDDCSNSKLPVGVTTTGTVTYADQYRRLGQTPATTNSTYVSPSFAFYQGVTVTVYWSEVSGYAAGEWQIRLIRDSDSANLAYLGYQSDGNEVFYKNSGAVVGSAGLVNAAAGDLYRSNIQFGGLQLACEDHKGWIPAAAVSRFNAAGSNSLTITDSTVVHVVLLTTSTRRVNLHRIKVYSGPPE